jgi:hypothetical protein
MKTSKFKLAFLFVLFLTSVKVFADLLNKHEINKSLILPPLSPIAFPLYITAEEFKAWHDENGDAKIIFQFEFNRDKNLVIAGWAANGDDYNDYEPSLILTPDVNDNNDKHVIHLDTKDSFFLGNLKLKTAFVKKIYKNLYPDSNNNTPKYRFVVFMPIFDADSHIYYQIYLNDDLPNKTPLAGGKKLIAKTDPSPPAPHQ